MSGPGPSSTTKEPVYKVTLRAKDGTSVVVDRDVAFKSEVIYTMYKALNHTCMDTDEPLTVEMSGEVLKKIAFWCEEHRYDADREAMGDMDDPRVELTEKNKEFLNVPDGLLMDMLEGANYLNIPGLVEIITQKVAIMASNKSVDQLRAMFGLENDFTAEEERENDIRFKWILNPSGPRNAN